MKMRLLFGLTVASAVFFACAEKETLEEAPACDSSIESCEPSPSVSSNSNSGGVSSGTDIDNPDLGSSSHSQGGDSSNSEGDGPVAAPSSSSVDLGLNCAYKSAWCGGIVFGDVVTASIAREYVKEDEDGNEVQSCIFATAIEQMGNESAGFKINGETFNRCGNTWWGQPSCEDALKDVQKADGGYYIWIGKWAGDFNTTGGAPVCDGSGSGSSSPSGSSSSGSVVAPSSSSAGSSGNGNCAYLPIWCGGAAQSSIATTAPTLGEGGEKCFFATSVDAYCAWGGGTQSSKINGVDVGQGNIGCWSSNGALPAKVDGGYYIWVGGGLSDWKGTAGSPVCSGGSGGGGSSASSLTCANLATTGTAGTAITQPAVRCNNTSVATNNVTFSGNPIWNSPIAGTYDVTVKANSGACSGQSAECGRVVVAASASSLTCSGLAQTGVSGAAITQPTVRCNNTAVSASSITWGNNPTWANPTAGTYNVTARATCGGSQVTADCGRIVVSTPSLTCGSVTQTVTLPTKPMAPTVGCGGNTITTGITFANGTTAFSFTNPPAAGGTYNNIRATATCGGSSQTANCSGTLTVNPEPTLTCASVPTTGTAGSPITSPTVKCGNDNVSANQITWSASSTLNWTNPAAGTYTNIRATATCGGSSKTANCSGTLTVSASSTLTCTGTNQTVTAGTALTQPTVRCGNSNATGITWTGAPSSWTSPTAGTYNNIRATATCSGTSQTATCTGTIIVNSSTSSGGNSSASTGGSNPSYPALVAGQSGVMTGYATRYWDACKANCTWGGKTQALGFRCKACDDKGLTEIAAENTTSSCVNGGTAYACFDQTPYKVNDNLSYAFAATPGNGSDCGKCYQLQFDGTGKYSTNGAHTAIKGKTIIVISSNIGYDVSGGQFDVMIPGGGVGEFNALTKQLNGLGMNSVSNSTLGAQYGGLLTACQSDLGYNASVSQYQSCVKQKCTQNFGGSNANLAPMKAGCDWFADWMMAADNPNVLYKQVTCPQYLIDKYKATK